MVKLFFNDGSNIVLQQCDTLYGSSSSSGDINKLNVSEYSTSEIVSAVTKFIKVAPSFVKNHSKKIYLSSRIIKISTK